MLEDSKRPETYWEESRKHAGYIYNRIPPTRKPGKGPWKSPQAACYKRCRGSNLKHLSILFGIDVLAFVPKDKREEKHHGDKAQ